MSQNRLPSEEGRHLYSEEVSIEMISYTKSCEKDLSTKRQPKDIQKFDSWEQKTKWTLPIYLSCFVLRFVRKEASLPSF